MNEQELTQFLDIYLSKVAEIGLNVSGYNLDHLAYQACNTKDYEIKKQEILPFSASQHETTIGGRKVAVYELTKPLIYRNYRIIALEIIAPKLGQICSSHWEHGEFVTDEPYNYIISKYPELKWDTSSSDRAVYSHLKLKLSEDMQLKFHRQDILKTIELEKQQQS